MPSDYPTPARSRSLNVGAAVWAVMTAGLWVGCSAPQTNGVCGRHDECRTSEYCAQGRCVDGDRSLPLDVSNMEASQWFTFTNGTCRFDEQCGPWVCHADRCVSPAAAGRALPPRDEIAYWDGSCAVASDCGPWSCLNSWCTDPEFASPTTVAVMPIGNGDGRVCAQDSECGGDADCVQPGRCHLGMSQYAMTFADIPASTWFDYSDGSCTYDTHCGPWACQLGRCIAPEQIGRSVPSRSNFAYYDSSCSAPQQCGIWSCIDGWCRDPQYASVYSANPNGTGMALTGSGAYGYGYGYGGYGTYGYGSYGFGYGYGSYGYVPQPYGLYGYGGAGPGYGYGSLGYGSVFGSLYCSTHLDCPTGNFCQYPGTCVVGDGSVEFDASAMDPSSWYANPDGRCTYDDECGPWMCSSQGLCATPQSVGRAMQTSLSYHFDDSSCSDDTHCGAWICSNGWCTEPGYASP